jgi:hypothetical protein
MIVDATWPLSARGMGTVINESFVPGENQRIAVEPLKSWVVPEDRDSQEFKDEILKESFTPQELAHRDEFVKALSKVTNSRLVRFLVWLKRLLTGQDAG